MLPQGNSLWKSAVVWCILGMYIGCCYFLFKYSDCLCPHCVKSWSLTHGTLFSWPLTLLAEKEVKKGILKFAKYFTGKLVGEGGACSMLCGQHKMCYSRAVGVWKETWSAVSATTRHKHVSKLPQSCSVCFWPFCRDDSKWSSSKGFPQASEWSMRSVPVLAIWSLAGNLQTATRMFTK